MEPTNQDQRAIRERDFQRQIDKARELGEDNQRLEEAMSRAHRHRSDCAREFQSKLAAVQAELDELKRTLGVPVHDKRPTEADATEADRNAFHVFNATLDVLREQIEERLGDLTDQFELLPDIEALEETAWRLGSALSFVKGNLNMRRRMAYPPRRQAS